MASSPQAIFYLDHNFLKSMLTMFRKINAKERVVGFYSSGPELSPNDMKIYNIVNAFTKIYPAVYCIIDIRPNRPDLPVRTYKVVDETFQHVPTNMGAMEAEEIGVEHLLRDIHDPTVSTCAAQLQAKLSGLVTLHEKLVDCRDYLRDTASPNPEILGNLQRILALLPVTDSRSLLIQSNDMHLSMYLGSLIRTVIALHDLLNNKIKYGNDEEEADAAAMVEEEKKVDPTATAPAAPATTVKE
jgi:26S proteasome regulatory subunit N8